MDAPRKTTGLNLLIPEKADSERESLAASFSAGGGQVHRIGRFWDPPALDPKTVRVYGPDSFVLVLQQKLGFALTSPDDDLIFRVPAEYLSRKILRATLQGSGEFKYPAFIKPLVPKQFRGAVYPSSEALAAECRGLAPDTAIAVSDVVKFTAEVRCFILNGEVLEAASYEGTGDTNVAIDFVRQLAKAVTLPRAIVVDVGLIADTGWSVIEFNAAWGAGLNGCDPERVLPAIVAASGPQP